MTGLESMGRCEGLEEQQRGLRDRGLQDPILGVGEAPHPSVWEATISFSLTWEVMGAGGKCGKGEFTLNPVLQD